MSFIDDVGDFFDRASKPLQKSAKRNEKPLIGVGVGAAAAAVVAISGGSAAPLIPTILAGGLVGGIQGSRSNKSAGDTAAQAAIGGGLTGGAIALGSRTAAAGAQARATGGYNADGIWEGPVTPGEGTLSNLGAGISRYASEAAGAATRAASKAWNWTVAAPGKVEDAVLNSSSGAEARKSIGKAAGDLFTSALLLFGAGKARGSSGGGENPATAGAGGGPAAAGSMPGAIAGGASNELRDAIASPGPAGAMTPIVLLMIGVALIAAGFWIVRGKKA